MWSITGNMVQPIKPQTEPMLNGITLRPDQLELVNQIAIYQRGVIKAPTGSGKTITALGAVSMFPGMRVLILVHRKEILKQFADRIYKHLALRGHPQLILEGNRPQLHGTVVAMIQTFVKYPVEEVCDKFDIVMIDEVHRCWDRKGQYGQFLNGCLAPMKIGFSATEGLVGPPIGELTVAEGQELGIIVKPYITLKIVPYDASVGDYRRYRELYQYGIVENRARNAIIIKEAKARAMANKSSLIIIRDTAKEALERKTHLTVIASDIWEEGIDIVSLNTVVAAGAGKSKRKTLQIVGRGMRTAPGKDRVEVIDFLDPYRYLARHAVARFTAYAEKGWL
jgi:superfamily II DNA or RNA helicase